MAEAAAGSLRTQMLDERVRRLWLDGLGPELYGDGLD